jgi:mono/diheme cytochrome c family protein
VFSLAMGMARLLPSEDMDCQQLLQRYCIDCHQGESAEGGIRLDQLDGEAIGNSQVELVEKMILVLKERQMPPADSEQPTNEERVATLDWIERRLKAFDCGSVSRPGRVTLRRLNRAEYDNSIRDLTGLQIKLSTEFPSDDVGSGFDNIGDVLSLPPILMEKYLDAAQKVADAVLSDPQAVKRVFPLEVSDEKNIEEVIQVARANADGFARRAFRRPLTAQESDRFFELMQTTFQAGESRETILQTVISVVLASPHFLFRVEDDRKVTAVDGIAPLNSYELASRLSYFLWSSLPDERLSQLADEGKLLSAEERNAEVERMLADEKSQALVTNFASQWLQLRDLDTLSPDPNLFSEFDEELRKSMRQETELLFSYLLKENRSILELLGAEYSFVNQRLARHYGIDGVDFDGFRRVSLGGKRRGMLMHGSILLLTSNPTRTSPVKRGKWVLENLLAEPPPPPPPDVPELAAEGEQLGNLRQRMEQHRENPNCAVCHNKMDAVGFGLENFDAIGKWRENDGREPIDPSGELPGGRSFRGPIDLVEVLAESKKREFTRCLTGKLLTYALGRGLGVADRCTVNSIVEAMERDGYRFQSLVKAIVNSTPFTLREVGEL